MLPPAPRVLEEHWLEELNAEQAFRKVKIFINETHLLSGRSAHSDWTLWRIAAKLDRRGFGDRSRKGKFATRSDSTA
jgi:hypothetical protein